MPPRRILARAGTAATALVVAGVAISQSGEIWGGGGESFSARPAPQAAEPSAGADTGGGAPSGEGRNDIEGTIAANEGEFLGRRAERTALKDINALA